MLIQPQIVVYSSFVGNDRKQKSPGSAATDNRGFMRRWGWIAGTVTERHTAKIVPGLVVRRTTGCGTSGRFSGDDQSFQSGFNHGDFFFDLADWQAEVVARSCARPELERQLLPMLPEIFKRATVLMPDVHLDDLLHRFRHLPVPAEIATTRRDWNQLTRLPHGGTIFPAIFTGLRTPSLTRCEPNL
jgi:hypothetical protein